MKLHELGDVELGLLQDLHLMYVNPNLPKPWMMGLQPSGLQPSLSNPDASFFYKTSSQTRTVKQANLHLQLTDF